MQCEYSFRSTTYYATNISSFFMPYSHIVFIAPTVGKLSIIDSCQSELSSVSGSSLLFLCPQNKDDSITEWTFSVNAADQQQRLNETHHEQQASSLLHIASTARGAF